MEKKPSSHLSHLWVHPTAHLHVTGVCCCAHRVCVKKTSKQHFTCKTGDTVKQRSKLNRGFLSFLWENYHELMFGARYVTKVLVEVKLSGDHHYHCSTARKNPAFLVFEFNNPVSFVSIIRHDCLSFMVSFNKRGCPSPWANSGIS